MKKIIYVLMFVCLIFLCCEGGEMAPNAKPDKLPEFASTDVNDPVTGQPNVVEPPEAKKDRGWNFLEKPPRNWMNWLHRKNWQWLVYFNQFFSSTHQFKTNEIVEFDADQGVTVDGVLIKDGNVTATTTIINSGVSDFPTGSVIRFKVLEIGNWDMTSFGSATITHGLTKNKIINAWGIIRNDTDSERILAITSDFGVTLNGSNIGINNTIIYINREAGGVFDSSGYSSTPYNRGWVFIQYID